jgi:hypothetical protein
MVVVLTGVDIASIGKEKDAGNLVENVRIGSVCVAWLIAFISCTFFKILAEVF